MNTLRWLFLGLITLCLTSTLGCGGTNSCEISASQGNYCREVPSDHKNVNDGSAFPSGCKTETKKEDQTCGDQGFTFLCDEGDGTGVWVKAKSDCQWFCHSGASYPFC